MGTTHDVLPHRTAHAGKPSRARFLVVAALLVLVLVAAGCTSVRPVVKIGLIAPFEGLYRDTGYAALAALRQGIADCAAPGQDVLPLALDDSADPALARRAAQKLLADPAVVAVIGPFPVAAVPAVGEVIAAADRPWIVPGLVTPAGGFDDPTNSAWVVALAEAVVADQSPVRVIIVGLPPTLALELPPAIAQTPLSRAEEPTTVTFSSGDAVLWLAAPDAGAEWVADHPGVPIWLGTPYGGDIWARQAPADATAHWLIWRDPKYNDGSQPSALVTPPAAQTYHATCAILLQLGSTRAATATPWQLITRRLSAAP